MLDPADVPAGGSGRRLSWSEVGDGGVGCAVGGDGGGFGDGGLVAVLVGGLSVRDGRGAGLLVAWWRCWWGGCR